TPLTSIKAYFQLLERSIEDTNLSRNYLGKTHRQLNKLQDLIADLLDISKIESGRLKFNKKLFDLEPVLLNGIEIIRQTHNDIHIVKQGNAHVKIYGDEVRIEQVLINYLTNAIKYSPGDKNVEINISQQDNHTIRIGVRDFGIGIP